ncbi:MAG: putative toxin-antitoxin system toxin component, PIN family, partial [bacterium]
MAIVCVVDTNVFLGALIGQHGINRKLIRYCLQKKIIPIMGNALFTEYEDVLQREPLFLKCPLTPTERNTLFEAFLSVCIWTKIYYGFRPNLIDEGDNHLMELAIAGCA